MTRTEYLKRYDAVCEAEDTLHGIAVDNTPEINRLLVDALNALQIIRLDFWDKAHKPEYWS